MPITTKELGVRFSFVASVDGAEGNRTAIFSSLSNIAGRWRMRCPKCGCRKWSVHSTAERYAPWLRASRIVHVGVCRGCGFEAKDYEWAALQEALAELATMGGKVQP